MENFIFFVVYKNVLVNFHPYDIIPSRENHVLS